jgi:hypothetical protein
MNPSFQTPCSELEICATARYVTWKVLLEWDKSEKHSNEVFIAFGRYLYAALQKIHGSIGLSSTENECIIVYLENITKSLVGSDMEYFKKENIWTTIVTLIIVARKGVSDDKSWKSMEYFGRMFGIPVSKFVSTEGFVLGKLEFEVIPSSGELEMARLRLLDILEQV